MPQDLRAKLKEYRDFFDEIMREFDKCSARQRELLREIIARADEKTIAKIRAALKNL